MASNREEGGRRSAQWGEGRASLRVDQGRLEAILESFSRVCLLVAGDVVVDEYLWGEVERISPEAPVPVVRVERESLLLGGAGNVVRNVAALGGRCVFCTVVGDDDDGRRVVDLLKDQGVDTQGVVVAEGRQTTRKTRVVARAQQVVRYDRESLEAIPADVVRRVLAFVDATRGGVDAAILEDYGKGFFSRRLIGALMERLCEAGLAVAVDPKLELSSYRGVTLLKPNLREAEFLTGVSVRSPEDLESVARRLRKSTSARDIVVTRGSDGATIFEGDRPAVEVPTVARDVFDVQGAGDTSMATLALARCAGATLLEAAVLANAAAGVVVAKLGTATASRDELREGLPGVVAAVEGRS